MSLFKFTALAAAALITAAPAVAQDRTDWPQSITIGTASQGGTYFVYGNGLAGYIGEALGINASGEVTGGPVQNATLVQLGDHAIGLVTMGPAYEAWTGRSELAPGLEHHDLRALFPMYQTPFQVITMANSGITSVTELAGRRVSVGPAGGTPGTYWPRFLETLGVDANVSNAGAADAAGQLKDGLIDAFAFAAGVPISAFSQLAAEADVRMFGFTESELATLLAAHPEVAPLNIPAGTYPGHDYDQQSVSMWNYAIANASMPESLAYEIVKLVMENPDRMMEIHRAAAETIMDNVLNNTFMPFHPGAVRYYQEHGIEIPENLRG
ncbi:TAXI family TRAP transporter solute-binding subunit [Pararhodobacter zhoushanensis]|uniref:TAXI family TRAP transporter solute-binding subunit n=1 Tax=Pararhodobacter zhoushanensis TaxID=2479545 RepID=UPI000F8F1E69|nr:TAXI family TRAP transporter solute-binding subunit [Pararhodobacter zhoushanensis]